MKRKANNLLLQILVIVEAALASRAVKAGLGRHSAEMSDAQLLDANEWTITTNAVAIFGIPTPKLAVAILLVRILAVGRPSRALQFSLYAPALLMVVLAVVQFGILFGQCQPIEGSWNPFIEAKCYNPNIFYVSAMIWQGMAFVVNVSVLKQFTLPMHLQLIDTSLLQGCVQLSIFIMVSSRYFSFLD